jgi:hypothetical protein
VLQVWRAREAAARLAKAAKAAKRKLSVDAILHLGPGASPHFTHRRTGSSEGNLVARAMSGDGPQRSPLWRARSGDLTGALDLASSSSALAPPPAAAFTLARRNSLDSTRTAGGLATLTEARVLSPSRDSPTANLSTGGLLGEPVDAEDSEGTHVGRVASGASGVMHPGGQQHPLQRSPSGSSLGEALSKMSPGLLRLSSEEAAVFQGVFEDVDALRREVRNGNVLCGLTEQPPSYLPPVGYRELLALLWDHAARKGPPLGFDSTAPAPAKADEMCATPMWGDRVLHRGSEKTLQQLTGAAHMKLPTMRHKPISATFSLTAAQLPSLLQSALDGGGGGGTDPGMDVCVLRLSNLQATGLPRKSSSLMGTLVGQRDLVHVVFQGQALLTPETMSATHGTAPPVARTASSRVRHSAVTFDEDELPVLRSAFVHRQQLAHTCVVLSVIDTTSWTSLDATGVLVGSASLALSHAAAAHDWVEFRLPLTAAGRVVGELSGEVMVEDSAARLPKDEGDILIQTVRL